ncbi:MAG: hypothetical protein JO235_02860 [Chroococcidiopsidaceae cyanobacterium CP_BM_RX_35]|nr:hypothetical protein [Chroococcidiopsidaceae cyanobacterium CP_BM_RX_35]
MTVCKFKPGLENVPMARTKLSYVDGQQGILEYRGIRIEELAQKRVVSQKEREMVGEESFVVTALAAYVYSPYMQVASFSSRAHPLK